jgi:hypothetical protein
LVPLAFLVEDFGSFGFLEVFLGVLVVAFGLGPEHVTDTGCVMEGRVLDVRDGILQTSL